MENYFAKPWQKYPVTHPGTWGIETESGGVFNPWFEMAAGLIAAKAKNATICCGIDNFFYLTILVPAIFIASGRTEYLPSHFIYNEFLCLDGEKFSTSRQHALWVDETLAEYSPDFVRFYLCYKRPETFEESMSLTELEHFIQQFIQHTLAPWLAGIKPPQSSGDACCWAEKDFAQRLAQYQSQLSQHYTIQGFSPRQIAAELMALVCDAKRFQQYQAHSPLNYRAAKLFIDYATPIMPAYCQKLSGVLHHE